MREKRGERIGEEGVAAEVSLAYFHKLCRFRNNKYVVSDPPDQPSEPQHLEDLCSQFLTGTPHTVYPSNRKSDQRWCFRVEAGLVASTHFYVCPADVVKQD